MAYGLKHYIDFKDIKGVPYRIGLLYQDFDGDPTPQRAAPEPFIQDIQVDNIYKPIWGTIFEINAMTQLQPSIDLSSFKLEDLFISDEKECLIEFRKNPNTDNALLFKGWLSGHKTTVPLNGGDWPMSLTAGCGLGLLKNILFSPDSGLSTSYVGKKSYLELITICLQKTGLSLPFSVSCSWEAWNGDTSEWVFNMEVDVAVYYDENQEPYDCAKVLADALEKFNCIIFQEYGRYYIINVDERGREEIELKNFDANGTYINTTTYEPRKSITYDGDINLGVTSYSATPPKRRFDIKVDLKNVGKNLVKNGSFVDRFLVPIVDVTGIRNWNYTYGWFTLKTLGIEIASTVKYPTVAGKSESEKKSLYASWMATHENYKLTSDAIEATINAGGYEKIRVKIKYVSYATTGSYPVCVYSISLKNSANQYCYLKEDGTWTLERTYDTYLLTKDVQTEVIYDGQPVIIDVRDVEMRLGYETISNPFTGAFVDSMFLTIYKPSVITEGSEQKVLILDARIDVYETSKATKLTAIAENDNVSSSYEKETFSALTGTQNAPYSLSQVFFPDSNTNPSRWNVNPDVGVLYRTIFDIMLRKRAYSNSRNRLLFEGELYDHEGQVRLLDTLLIDYFPGGTKVFAQTRRRYDYRKREIKSLILEELIQ